MEKLIKQAKQDGNWKLWERLLFLDFVMDEMIMLEQLADETISTK